MVSKDPPRAAPAGWRGQPQWGRPRQHLRMRRRGRKRGSRLPQKLPLSLSFQLLFVSFPNLVWSLLLKVERGKRNKHTQEKQNRGLGFIFLFVCFLLKPNVPVFRKFGVGYGGSAGRKRSGLALRTSTLGARPLNLVTAQCRVGRGSEGGVGGCGR